VKLLMLACLYGQARPIREPLSHTSPAYQRLALLLAIRIKATVHNPAIPAEMLMVRCYQTALVVHGNPSHALVCKYVRLLV